ncbi:MAG: tRNA (adenosine(37)-N6)-dimethylallyltransferase MiaA [Chitinophagaceae bacterium]
MRIDDLLAKKFPKTVIVIAGPTASGKTAIAVELAKHYQAEIISADSRQCFKELNIGVARPSVDELSAVPHHFVASHSIHEKVDAALFEQYALQKVNELFEQNDIVIIAGGTGLYIKAFCEGMDEIPEVKPGIREKIVKQFAEKGKEWLQEEIQKKDPGFYMIGEIQNPQRMMRALEVLESTGQSILHFRKGNKAERNFNIVKIGLAISKEDLHQNINRRTEKMIEAGLVDEVRSLINERKLNALHTVGYTEIFDYLDNKISLDTAIEQIKTNTRQYAKRQLTWFKKDKEIRWMIREELINEKGK